MDLVFIAAIAAFWLATVLLAQGFERLGRTPKGRA